MFCTCSCHRVIGTVLNCLLVLLTLSRCARNVLCRSSNSISNLQPSPNKLDSRHSMDTTSLGELEENFGESAMLDQPSAILESFATALFGGDHMPQRTANVSHGATLKKKTTKRKIGSATSPRASGKKKKSSSVTKAGSKARGRDRESGSKGAKAAPKRKSAAASASKSRRQPSTAPKVKAGKKVKALASSSKRVQKKATPPKKKDSKSKWGVAASTPKSKSKRNAKGTPEARRRAGARTVSGLRATTSISPSNKKLKPNDRGARQGLRRKVLSSNVSHFGDLGFRGHTAGKGSASARSNSTSSSRGAGGVCKCKKSLCLKKYCECFSALRYCMDCAYVCGWFP